MKILFITQHILNLKFSVETWGECIRNNVAYFLYLEENFIESSIRDHILEKKGQNVLYKVKSSLKLDQLKSFDGPRSLLTAIVKV